MQDTSVFETPDEFPEITALIRRCQEFSEIESLDPVQLLEALDALRGAITQATVSLGRGVTDPDSVLHAIRNEHGKVQAVVEMSRDAWIALLTMNGGDDNGNGVPT